MELSPGSWLMNVSCSCSFEETEASDLEEDEKEMLDFLR